MPASLGVRSTRQMLLRFTIATAVLVPTSLAGAQSAPKAPPRETPRQPESQKIEVDLRPRFRVGSDRRVVLKQETSQTVPSLDAGDGAAPGTTSAVPGKRGGPAAKQPPAEQRVSSTTELTLVFRPTRVDDTGASVDVIIDAIRATRKGGDADDTFDSSRPATQPGKKPSGKPSNPKTAPGGPDADAMIEQLMAEQSLESQMRPLVGEKMTLRLDADGDVVEVQGGERLVAALSPMSGGLASLGDLTGAGDSNNAKDIFKSIVGGPGKPKARVGESWDSTTQLDMAILGPMRMRTQSTLSSFRGGVAQIDMRGGLEPRSESGDNAAGRKASKSQPAVDVNYSGSCLWDSEDGFVRSMNLRQLSTVRLELAGKQSTITSESTTNVTTSRGITPRSR